MWKEDFSEALMIKCKKQREVSIHESAFGVFISFFNFLSYLKNFIKPMMESLKTVRRGL